MKKRFSDEQIIGILAEAEQGSGTIRDVCRRHNLTEQPLFRWRNKYSGMGASEVRRLQELELQNSRLKLIVAEQMLAIDGLKEIAGSRKLFKSS